MRFHMACSADPDAASSLGRPHCRPCRPWRASTPIEAHSLTMSKKLAGLLFALVLSGAWIMAGASWLFGEPANIVSKHVRERAGICDMQGLTEADRAACEASLHRSEADLQNFQDDLRQGSMKVALIILLMVGSFAAGLMLLANALLALGDRVAGRGKGDARFPASPEPGPA